jgi:hypothetical protein
VWVLQNRRRGPLIVEAHGARIALGRRQAERVLVEAPEQRGGGRTPADDLVQVAGE